MFRLQPGELQMAEPWHQMQAHELRVTVMCFRADRESDGVDRTISGSVSFAICFNASPAAVTSPVPVFSTKTGKALVLPSANATRRCRAFKFSLY